MREVADACFGRSVFAGPLLGAAFGEDPACAGVLRLFRALNGPGPASQDPHAAGAPIVSARANPCEHGAHIRVKALKVKLTGCNLPKGRGFQAPIISAPTSIPISMRTQRRSTRRIAFTMASAMRSPFITSRLTRDQDEGYALRVWPQWRAPGRRGR